MNLDDLIRECAPPVAERSPALLEDVDALVSQQRPTKRRSRRGLRWAAAGLVVAGVAGVAGAAAADGKLPFRWTSEQGGVCRIESATVELAERTTDSQVAMAATTLAERKATLAEARNFLSTYDYAAVDRPAAIKAWQKVEAEIIEGQPDPAERQPYLEGDELEVQALIYKLGQDMNAHLRALGMRPEVLMPTFGYNGWTGTDGVFRCTG
jgi:hypothetical protein